METCIEQNDDHTFRSSFKEKVLSTSVIIKLDFRIQFSMSSKNLLNLKSVTYYLN